MVEHQALTKILKEAMKGGRYSLGASEVIADMKGAKLVICSKSLVGSARTRVAEEAKKNAVQVLALDRSSMELGRMLGRPFRVSAIALRSLSEADLRQLTGGTATG